VNIFGRERVEEVEKPNDTLKILQGLDLGFLVRALPVLGHLIHNLWGFNRV
jgi:hypothetical protein